MYYFKSWTRLSPYIFGLWMGNEYAKFKSNQDCLLSNIKSKIERSTFQKWLFILTGLAILNIVFFLPRFYQKGYNMPKFFMWILLSTERIIFVAALNLILLPNILGINSFISGFLSNPLFRYFGRISFCAYLVHNMVIQRN